MLNREKDICQYCYKYDFDDSMLCWTCGINHNNFEGKTKQEINNSDIVEE